MSSLLELERHKREFWAARPDPLSHVAFAYTLTIPDSQDDNGHLEPYDPKSHPGQWHTLSALDGASDRPGFRYIQFVLISDTQGGGKSWLLQQCAFRDMVETGQSVIYALPTRDLGGDIWSLKLRPAISGAGLQGYLPEFGPASKGGSKPRFVPFIRKGGKGGGTLVFMAAGGRGQSGQAALTARKLLVDEVDDWEQDALHRIKRRVDRNADTAIQFYACTVKKDDSKFRENDHSNIVDLYEKSTQGRIEYQCPHCNDYTRLEWETFKYEGTAKEEIEKSVHLCCTKCAGILLDTHRKGMFGRHRYAMDKPFANVWGLRLTALDCPWKSLAWLADLLLNALADRDKGNHEPMRQFAHDQQARQYRDDENVDDIAAKIDPQYLLRRSSASEWGPSQHFTDREGSRNEGSARLTYSRHIAPLPEAAKWIVVAVDVQANRCYWLLSGGAPDGSTYDVAWGYEHATSDREEMTPIHLHQVLDRIDGLTREIAESIPIVRRGVDANFNTDHVIAWLKTHPEWWPLYGASAAKASKMKHKDGEKLGDFPGILYLRRSDGWHLRQHRCHIDTNPMRMAAQREFLRKPNEPGAAHLPNGLGKNASDMAYLQHLCAEMWDEKKMKWEKPKGAGRWDWLDDRTYCTALHRHHLATLKRPRPPSRKYGFIKEI